MGTALHVITFFSAVCAIVCCTTAVLFNRETMDQDLPDRASSFSSSRGVSSYVRSSRDRDRASSINSTLELAESRAATPLRSRDDTSGSPRSLTPEAPLWTLPEAADSPQ